MGVKIAHVHNGRVPLVEGPLVVNEYSSSFLIKSWRILSRPSPLNWLDVQTKHQCLKGPPGTMNHETDPAGP